VDLGQETIDMGIVAEGKETYWSGLFRDYSNGFAGGSDVEASGAGAATAAAVGGVMLILEIFVPVFLIEQVWQFFSSDDDSGCSDYIEEHQVESEEFKAK
jgi:hypothetical protein